MSVSIRDWPKLARQMFNHTTPGGWVEINDHPLRKCLCDDDSVPANSAVALYMTKLSASLEAAGINVDIDSEYIKKILEDVGFVDIRVTTVKVRPVILVIWVFY